MRVLRNLAIFLTSLAFAVCAAPPVLGFGCIPTCPTDVPGLCDSLGIRDYNLPPASEACAFERPDPELPSVESVERGAEDGLSSARDDLDEARPAPEKDEETPAEPTPVQEPAQAPSAPGLPEGPSEVPEPTPIEPPVPGIVVRSTPLGVFFEEEVPAEEAASLLPDPAPAGEPQRPILAQAVYSPPPSIPMSLASVTLASAAMILYVVFAGFYNRLSRDRVANHPLRQRLLETVARDPGLGCAAAAAHLGVHHTTAAHHLRILAKWKLVEARKTTLGDRFFAAGAEIREAGWRSHVVLRKPWNQSFLRAAVARGVFRPIELARELGIPKSTATYRARALLREGLLERRGSGLALAPAAAALGLVANPSTTLPVAHGSTVPSPTWFEASPPAAMSRDAIASRRSWIPADR